MACFCALGERGWSRKIVFSIRVDSARSIALLQIAEEFLMRNLLWFLTALVMTATIGCVSVTKQKKDREILDASQEGEFEGTGTSSTDIRSMAERMARDIVSISFGALSPVRIAMLEIDNQTRFPLNPNIIKDRLLANLVEFSQNTKMIFTENSSNADYLLSARITALSKGSNKGVNDYLLYSFRLINKASGDVMWMKAYETKRQSNVGVIYR
jgi:hypothetical protein